MLDHPRAKEALNEFVSQWMRFDRVLTASKDKRKFPTVTRETAVAMTEEARAFVSDLVWSDRNFMELFTADYGYPDGDLAGIYGVKAPPREFERVPFPADRSGQVFSGKRLFLAITAKPEDSSPTARGLFVREQFLCQHVPDPPAGVNTNLPPFTEAMPQTNRERMSEHATNPSCATCHKLIDPIGFGLERFDAIGAKREKFRLQFPAGGRRRRRQPAGADEDRGSRYRRHRVRSRDSGFGVLVSVATGSRAGEERPMPGVHGEAVFPLHGGTYGDAGGSSG